MTLRIRVIANYVTGDNEKGGIPSQWGPGTATSRLGTPSLLNRLKNYCASVTSSPNFINIGRAGLIIFEHEANSAVGLRHCVNIN